MEGREADFLVEQERPQESAGAEGKKKRGARRAQVDALVDKYGREHLWESLATQLRAKPALGDLYPSHYMIRATFDHEGLSLEERVWRCFVYWLYNHLGAAEMCWRAFDPWTRFPPGWRTPTSIERRGMRGNDRASETVAAVIDQGWRCLLPDDTGSRGWERLRAVVGRLPHAGPWSEYRWAGICSVMLDLPIEAPDMGTGGQSKTAGPIAALMALTGEGHRECCEPMLHRRVWDRLADMGSPLERMEFLETCLCDFSRMLRGRYYVTAFIDSKMDEIVDADSVLWAARARHFPPGVLGELNGWWGLRRHLLPLFRDTGQTWLPEGGST